MLFLIVLIIVNFIVFAKLFSHLSFKKQVALLFIVDTGLLIVASLPVPKSF